MSDQPSDGFDSMSRRRILVFELLAVSGVFVLPALASSVLEFGVGLNPYAFYDVHAILTSIFSTIGFPFLLIFILWSSGEALSSFGLTKWNWGNHIPATIFLSCALFVLFLIEKGAWLEIKLPYFEPTDMMATRFTVMIVYFLCAAFFEEMFFRGYLIPRLTELWGSTWAAVMASSILSGFAHLYQGWLGVLFCTVMGFIFAYGFLIWRSIWPLTIAHAAFNFYLVSHLYWY